MILSYVLFSKEKILYSKVIFTKRGKFYKNRKFTNKDIDYVELKCDRCGKIYTNKNEYSHKKEPYCEKCKIEIKSLKKYGVKHYNQSKEKIEKCKETNLKKFGKETNLQTDEVKKILQKKYGSYNPFNNNEIRKKIRKTHLKKYGVDNPFKSEKIKEKILYDKNYKYFMNLKNRVYNVVPLFEERDYEGIGKEYLWKCSICGYEFKDNLLRGENPRCPKCFPTKSPSSAIETELEDFLKKYISIDTKNRKVISPKELDIYIDSKKIAIELDGLYWHSDLYKDKYYHLNKTIECEKKSIKLIHIFEDEWTYKRKIVESRLKNILGLNDYRIGARKTTIQEIDSSTKNKFLIKYHIQGADKSSIKLGAFFKNKLIGVMTFSKPRISLGQKHIKNGVFELSRFATISNTYTPGLASKMFKYFIRNYDPIEIYSYADRRWSQGDLYEKLGFTNKIFTGVNYWYVYSTVREHRFKYRKDQLKKFDNYSVNKTEKQIMKEMGYTRIYDCGNWKFTWKRNWKFTWKRN